MNSPSAASTRQQQASAAPDAASGEFWNEALANVTTRLATPGESLDAQRGLSAAQAAARLQTYGPNVLRPHHQRALLWQYLSRFGNPLVLVLLVASGVSAILGDVTSFVIIAVIVLISVTLDFVQEFRANQAAERLKQSVALKCQVVREGQVTEIPAAEVVPGDIVQLVVGDLVPADGRLLEARDFFVNQSFLTGESFPVEKHPGDNPAPTSSSEANNAVFMGTSVITGTARVLIVQTGSDTALGKIGGALDVKSPATAFARGTEAFGVMILRLTMLLVLFVLLVNALFHRPLFESFLFAVALAVGLTPELLPMVVSVTLARGAVRMSAQRVIVKRLSAVQDLGAMDVLCTDKTGTLTEGRIRLERHVDGQGNDSDPVLFLAYLNSHFETGLRSPLDEAIIAHRTLDVSAWHKLDEVPFDFERRRVSVLVRNAQQRRLVVKGAPEDVLRLCRYCDLVGDAGSAPSSVPSSVPVEMDDARRAKAQEVFDTLSAQGFRLLGVAWREVADNVDHAVVGDEAELVFAGYAAFLDPPKAGVAEVLRSLGEHGVAVKIVSGDNELVTRHLCEQIGFPITGVVTGNDMEQMDNPALAALAERANIFCRVNPSQKSRVIAALKSRGHVVGFLGDGINDAPSLHVADTGISVDSAVDVAKAAADLILMEHDLGVLRDGVREGRRTFANVMKYIMMGTSSNFGNMFSMAAAALALPFLPMLPTQVLLNNLLYDLSELALPFDRVDDDLLEKPAVWDIGFVRRYMLCFGPVSSIFDFLTFFLLLKVFHADEALFHTGWFVESIATQVLVIFIIRTRGQPWASRADWRVTTFALAVIAIAAALPYSPLASALGFVPMSASLGLAIVATVGAYLLAAQGMKWLFFKHLIQLGGRR